MRGLTRTQDAYGHAMYDHLRGKGGYEIVERDDGLIAHSRGPAEYFAAYKDWEAMDRKAIRFARGRVLDIGCGAGRVALYLQEKGHDVLGTDVLSRGAAMFDFPGERFSLREPCATL